MESDYISFEEAIQRQREIYERLKREMDDALKADAEDSIVTQLTRAEDELDKLKAAVKAFLEAWGAEYNDETPSLYFRAGIYVPQFSESPKLSKKPMRIHTEKDTPRAETLKALWEAVNNSE